jgi:hypothetical protein
MMAPEDATGHRRAEQLADRGVLLANASRVVSADLRRLTDGALMEEENVMPANLGWQRSFDGATATL